MKVYIDGGCQPNSGPVEKRIIRCVVTDESGIVLVDKTSRGGSNNIAELWALCEALEFAKSCQNVSSLEIFTDSKNNIAWFNGRIGKKLNDRQMVLTLYGLVCKLCLEVPTTVTWLPRHNNLAGLHIEQS